jgi:signal transduction histidine kinase
VQDAIESLGGMVVDSEVKLESSGAPDALVMADPDAMNQVFGNLIENSLKYGKAGKRIRVGAELLESKWSSRCRILGRALPLSIWIASSSGFIAWTRRARGSRAARGWDWRS